MCKRCNGANSLDARQIGLNRVVSNTGNPLETETCVARRRLRFIAAKYLSFPTVKYSRATIFRGFPGVQIALAKINPPAQPLKRVNVHGGITLSDAARVGHRVTDVAGAMMCF